MGAGPAEEALHLRYIPTTHKVCGASSQRSIIIWLSKSTQQNSCQQHRKFPNNLCRNYDTHSEPLYLSKIPPEFSQPTRSPSCDIDISTDHASDTRAFRTVPARWQFRPRISPAWLRQTPPLTQAPARSRCARPAHACPLLSRATAPAPSDTLFTFDFVHSNLFFSWKLEQ